MRVFSIFIVFIIAIACQNNKSDKPQHVDASQIKTLSNDSIKRDSILLKKIEDDNYVKDSIAAPGKRIKITKISGNSDEGSIKVEYRSIHEMVKGLKEKAEFEMWKADKYKSWIESDKSLYPGGEVVLSIFRSSELAAETESFDIIIQDNEGEEITRYQHITESPSVNYKPTNSKNKVRSYRSNSNRVSKSHEERRKEYMQRSKSINSPGKIVVEKSVERRPLKLRKDLWLNCKIIQFKKKVEFPFYIYVIDKYNEVRFKYKVEVIDKDK